MQKFLAISAPLLITAACAFAEEPIGVDIGLEVGISGFESDMAVTAKPSIAYGQTLNVSYWV